MFGALLVVLACFCCFFVVVGFVVVAVVVAAVRSSSFLVLAEFAEKYYKETSYATKSHKIILSHGFFSCH